MELVARNPFAFEVLSGEFKGLRKVRIGEYRLIYRIDSENESKTVRLLFVAHRRSFYPRPLCLKAFESSPSVRNRNVESQMTGMKKR